MLLLILRISAARSSVRYDTWSVTLQQRSVCEILKTFKMDIEFPVDPETGKPSSVFFGKTLISQALNAVNPTRFLQIKLVLPLLRFICKLGSKCCGGCTCCDSLKSSKENKSTTEEKATRDLVNTIMESDSLAYVEKYGYSSVQIWIIFQ